MKIMHLSDLHIGIRLHQYDLREEQRYIFQQIIDCAGKEQPDAVVIAGDIYDKSVPSAEAVKLFEAYPKKYTPAQWAFRWLWNQPEVTVVLSGMNSNAMVRENIQTASSVQVGELGEKEENLLQQVVKAINAKMKVGCTGCGYCQPCPFGVDIPGAFRCYNVIYTDNWFTGAKEYFMCTTLRAEPTRVEQCKKCGKCEKHCPQGIHIRDELENVKKRLENPVFKVTAAVAKMISQK